MLNWLRVECANFQPMSEVTRILDAIEKGKPG
jgi:hypothetical protein